MLAKSSSGSFWGQESFIKAVFSVSKISPNMGFPVVGRGQNDHGASTLRGLRSTQWAQPINNSSGDETDGSSEEVEWWANPKHAGSVIGLLGERQTETKISRP